MKMNDVSSRINEKLYEHKWYKRFTAITIVMSMLCTFYVPLDLIRPGMAAEGDSSTSQTTPGNTWFDDVQTSPLGDNLSEKLKGITIISGGKKYSTSPIIIDAGTVDPFLFDVALDYN